MYEDTHVCITCIEEEDGIKIIGIEKGDGEQVGRKEGRRRQS
jgi:hypothetical protein